MNGARQGAGTDKPGRNAPCPCGSGRKFKVCCASKSARNERAASINPAAVRAALSRAAHAQAGGRVLEAIAAFQQVVAFDTGNGAAALELGRLLLGINRSGEALPLLERAARQLPRSPQAHIQRGIALEHLGWHAEAADAYRRAIELAPRLAEAHGRLGITLFILDLRAEAAESFRRAAALAPKESLGRLSAAYALLAEGAVDEAQTALERVVAAEPGNAAARAELGKLLAESGKADAAWIQFESVVRLNPRAVAHYYDLARIRRLTEADRPLLEQMLAATRRSDLQELHRVMLELAIGKAFDDLGDHGQAMQHWSAAGKLKGRIRPLDRELICRRVDWQISEFGRERFAHGHADASSDRAPILILGMPRSGTTLVETVLACHSKVGAGQELPFWNQRGREMMDRGIVPTGEDLREIADSYLAVLRGISTAPHVTDKKPDNFMWAGLVHLVFPEARIIHCRRNPLDTCVSILGNFFAPRPDFSTEPGDLTFYYREYERVTTHWRETLPANRYMELGYEDLVSNPEPVIRRVLEFCELQWESACLHPEGSERIVNTASLWQVRQPIFRGSVGRWRRYEPWLAELRGLKREQEDSTANV